MASRYTATHGALTVTTIVTGTWRENCYVVSDDATRAALVFDPGDDAADILAVIDELNLHVERILLTHAHFDHVGGALALIERTGAPCEVHSADIKLFRRAPLYAMAFEKRRIELPEAVATFEEGAEYRVGEAVFRALLTPGHTPGSVCFVGSDFVVSGDTLLREAIGRTDLPGGDGVALLSSIEMLLARMPDAMVLFAGHGKPWSFGEARAWWQSR